MLPISIIPHHLLSCSPFSPCHVSCLLSNSDHRCPSLECESCPASRSESEEFFRPLCVHILNSYHDPRTRMWYCSPSNNTKRSAYGCGEREVDRRGVWSQALTSPSASSCTLFWLGCHRPQFAAQVIFSFFQNPIIGEIASHPFSSC